MIKIITKRKQKLERVYVEKINKPTKETSKTIIEEVSDKDIIEKPIVKQIKKIKPVTKTTETEVVETVVEKTEETNNDTKTV